jgi:hypothetical protein
MSISTLVQFVAEIDEFLADTGMSPTTFGSLAAGDGRFVRRLKTGGGATIRRLDKVRIFMRAYRATLELRNRA